MAAATAGKKTWAVLSLVMALLGGACTDEATPPFGDDDTDENEDPSQDDDQSDDDQGDDDDDLGDDDDDAPLPPKSDGSGAKLDAGSKPATDASKPATGLKDATVAPLTDGGVDDVDPPSDSGTKAPDASEPGEKADLGKGDGKDVIAIGDSWMSLFGNGIQVGLVKASGQKYRTYGVAGTRLLNEAIPGQYATAKRAGPDIKTVVMTGGGNDILLTGANPVTQIDKIAERLDKLWTEMGADGVKDVVYIEYSEGGSNGENVRMGIAKVGPICTNHKAVRCHFMLSDPIIMKVLADGIHPTADGFTKLGKAAFDLMVAKGMRR
jgi:hypothetical protein